MITNIHSTTVIVKDQEAALDFYINKLGWEKRIDQPMGPDMRFLTVAPVGAQTELVLGQPAMYDEGTGIKGGITLTDDDVDKTYEELSAKGVKFTQPVEQMPWGDRATWFEDPDGNSFFVNSPAQQG